MKPYLDLCSGIGGFAVAAEQHFQPIAFCEKNEFDRSVLQTLYPSVPIHEDLTKLDGRLFAPIPLVAAGFPCQPYSIAGHRGAILDDRYLWPHVLRVANESLTTWLLIENVAGFVELELDLVLTDLEKSGFESQPFSIPACAVGARHVRERVWIVAYSNKNRLQRSAQESLPRKSLLSQQPPARSVEDWIRLSVLFEPKLCRSLTEFPNGVDRIKAVGEAIVPDVARRIIDLIACLD